MKKTKYQTTKQQCQKQIDKLDNVCDWCGKKIIPIKTVNNGGEPTYWSGCIHGKTGKYAWVHFTQGVKKGIFDLASKLVLEDSLGFGMSDEDKESGNFDYAFQNAIHRTCEKISCIEWAKNNKPRNTKKQLRENFTKYQKLI